MKTKKIILKLIILFLLLLPILSCFGQNTVYQMTKTEIQNLPIDTSSVRKLLNLSETYKSSNLDLAVEYSLEAVKLSEQIQNELYLAKSYFKLGKCYQLRGNTKNALQFFFKALSLFKVQNKRTEIADTYNQISWEYYVLSNYELALEYTQKSIEINNNSALPSSYNIIAAIYFNKAEYIDALKFFQKAEKFYIKNNDTIGLGGIYNNIALVFFSQNDYQAAKEYLYKSLSLYKNNPNNLIDVSNAYNTLSSIFEKMDEIDSAKFYNQKALNICEQLKNYPEMVFILSNMARMNINNQNFDEAKKNFATIEKTTYYLEDNYLKGSYYSIKSDYFYELGDVDSAIYYLEENIKICKLYNHANLLLYNYTKLADIYYKQNNNKKAYKYLKKFISLNDSLFNIQKTELIENLKFSFETEKKELEISSLNNEVRLKAETLKQKKNSVIFLTVCLVLLGLFSLFISYLFSVKNKAYKLVVKKNNEVLEAEKKLGVNISNAEKVNKRENSDLRILSEKILKLIEIDKIYQDHKLSVSTMATKLDTNPRYISNTINEVFDKNFSNFINEYRIKFVCNLFIRKEYEKYTIKSLGQKAGFSTNTSFISAFKKFTGVTPSFYIKQLEQNL